MVLTATFALILSLLAMLPGLILCRAAPLDAGRLGAIGTASLATSLFATALLGAAAQGLADASVPAIALAPVSIVLAVAAWWATRGDGWTRPRIEWPALALTAGFIAWGVLIQRLAVGHDASGTLQVHAWYNADWFKHIGHVHALANHGVPARDIFAGARPLHYYWLLYVLPGAATALGGDAWLAMSMANGLCAGLLMLTLYGVVRHAGANARDAALASGWAAFACGPWQMWMAVTKVGGGATILALPDQPPGPLFTSFALYIPQHALALALLLGWAVIALAPPPARRLEHLLVLFGLATVMTISTLFGAGLLVAYGVHELLRRRWQAVPELAAMMVLVGMTILVVNVFQLGNPGSSMASPLMRDPVLAGTPLERAYQALSLVVRKNGLAFLAATVLWVRWRPAIHGHRNAWLLAGVLAGSALLLCSLTAAAPAARIVEEFRMREINLLVVAAAIAGGWAMGRARKAEARARWLIWIGATGLLIAALPGAMLLVQWHAQRNGMFVTKISAQDQRVLSYLRAHSAVQDRVWQFPEKPFLAQESGADNWSVILAGRTSLASERATDYPAARPMIDRAERYFRLEEVTVPLAARWIYLSRSLHPGSFDVLVTRLDADGGWARRACYADACLFERASARPR